MPLRIDIATLFPQMCEAVMGESIIGRARRAGSLEVHCHQIRDYTLNKHRNVDDTPCGHGKGMLMTADPIYRCWEAVCEQAGGKPHTIYMTPKGKLLTQQRAVEIAALEHVCIICGHYEGVDQRLIDEIVDEELSIGDYVLTGGELPALVLADCISRMCEGVLADESCWRDDSHVDGLLEYPHYTRPIEWHGRKVPDILLSGHRANIDRWRRDRSLELTLRVRPELLERVALSDADRAFLQSLLDQDPPAEQPERAAQSAGDNTPPQGLRQQDAPTERPERPERATQSAGDNTPPQDPRQQDAPTECAAQSAKDTTSPQTLRDQDAHTEGERADTDPPSRFSDVEGGRH